MHKESLRQKPVEPEKDHDNESSYNDRHARSLFALRLVGSVDEGRAMVARSLDRLNKLPLKTYGSGEEIYHQGDPANSLIVLRSGAVVGVTESERGLRRADKIVFGLSVLGDDGLVEAGERGSTLQAVVKCKAQSVDYATYRQMAGDNHEIAVFVQNALNIEMRDRLRRGAAYRDMSVTARVGVAILELNRASQKVDIGFVGQGFLGMLAGCHRETANRVISKLSRDEIIEPQINGSRSKIPKILDHKRLMNYIASNPYLGVEK